MDEIRIVGPGKTCGYPYPVCKKDRSQLTVHTQIRPCAGSKLFAIPSVFFQLITAGLPWSGENVWKMKFFPSQGKVREFCGWRVKFRKDLESQGI